MFWQITDSLPAKRQLSHSETEHEQHEHPSAAWNLFKKKDKKFKKKNESFSYISFNKLFLFLV